MNGSSLSTKLLVALAGQALFSLVLIVYVSQTQLPHLQFGVPRPIADYCVQLLAIIVPPAMLLLSVVALRSPRRSIQASVIAQLLVCLVAARFLVPELLTWLAARTSGGPDAFSLWVPLPLCSSPSRLLPSFITTSPLHAIPAMPNQGLQPTRLRRAVAMTDSNFMTILNVCHAYLFLVRPMAPHSSNASPPLPFSCSLYRSAGRHRRHYLSDLGSSVNSALPSFEGRHTSRRMPR